jgi:hypothetical protein
VGEEDDPVVADELMEVNRARGGVGLEVGGGSAQAEAMSRVSIARLSTGLQCIPVSDHEGQHTVRYAQPLCRCLGILDLVVKREDATKHGIWVWKTVSGEKTGLS